MIIGLSQTAGIMGGEIMDSLKFKEWARGGAGVC